MGIIVKTAARLVKVFDENGGHDGTVFPPGTSVQLDEPPKLSPDKSKVFVTAVPPLTIAGYVPVKALHRAYLQTLTGLSIEPTGAKYGSYKYREGEEQGIHEVRNQKQEPGDHTSRKDQNTIVYPRERKSTCPHCGSEWGNHKILETKDVQTRARKIAEAAGEVPCMLGVLRLVLPGGDTWFYGISGKQDSGNYADSFKMIRDAATQLYPEMKAAEAPAESADWLDFQGSPVYENWTSDVLEVKGKLVWEKVTGRPKEGQQRKANWSFSAVDSLALDDLGCAAPKLIQAAIHALQASGELKLLAQTTSSRPEIFMSEILVHGESKSYLAGHTADSCNTCRLTVWRFLCGYTNAYKKSDKSRPADWKPLSQILGRKSNEIKKSQTFKQNQGWVDDTT